MSAIAEKVAAEHRQMSRIMGGDVIAAYVCLCDRLYESPREFTEHVAEATEAAVRAQIAADIQAKIDEPFAAEDHWWPGLVAAARIARGEAS